MPLDPIDPLGPSFVENTVNDLIYEGATPPDSEPAPGGAPRQGDADRALIEECVALTKKVFAGPREHVDAIYLATSIIKRARHAHTQGDAPRWGDARDEDDSRLLWEVLREAAQFALEDDHVPDAIMRAERLADEMVAFEADEDPGYVVTRLRARLAQQPEGEREIGHIVIEHFPAWTEVRGEVYSLREEAEDHLITLPKTHEQGEPRIYRLARVLAPEAREETTSDG